jgi:GNAT superfamily N-acetyltransferase
MDVREARSEEFLAIVRLLEGALLEVDTGDVRRMIEAGDVLVRVAEGTVRGALVLDGRRIEAVAVRRTQRGRGIGSALVRAAADREGELVAEFDPEIRGFYEALGFETRCGVRCSGRLSGPR